MSEQEGAKFCRIVVNVDEKLRRAAKIKAAMTGKPMAEVMREALQRWVDDTGSEPAPRDHPTDK